jgi:hypothetical protein
MWKEEAELDGFFLFDGKEFQIMNAKSEYRLHLSPETPLDQCYSLLVREWRPDTWEFGTLFEVSINKVLSCSQLAELLHRNLYPHISTSLLFGTKVNILK